MNTEKVCEQPVAGAWEEIQAERCACSSFRVFSLEMEDLILGCLVLQADLV